MRKFLAIAFLLICALFRAQDTAQSNGDFVNYRDAAKTKKLSAGSFKDGKRNGTWTRWDPQGVITSQGNFRENKREGKWIFRHGAFTWPETYTLSTGNFKNGRRDSIWLLTDSAGNLVEKQQYIHKGNRAGYTSWHANGQKKQEGQFIYPEIVNDPSWDDQRGNGTMDGLWLEWFPNGKKKRSVKHIHGKKDGVEKEWHENGRKKASQTYLRGQKEGTHRAWDKNGVIVSLNEYKNDVGHGRHIVYHEGKKHYVEVYKEGKLLKATRYKENGDIESVKNYPQ